MYMFVLCIGYLPCGPILGLGVVPDQNQHTKRPPPPPPLSQICVSFIASFYSCISIFCTVTAAASIVYGDQLNK